MGELRDFDGKVLNVINEFYRADGFTPSVAEIAEKLGMSKGSVLADAMKRLEDAGLIVYHSTRKYYRPENWRALAGGQAADRLETELARKEKLLSAAKTRIEQLKARAETAATSAEESRELERIREQTKKRVQAWRDRQKKKT
jgi:DNA-binding transcriptional regulator GbsR (MarR family)